ncbi:MAG: hypothetical protein ACLU9Q_16605 [Marvinbryantia sp.]|uniref:hypothetical protein n=1 Tax=Marvinbryantia sp. TaxID=2496532 RepID=UPI0025D29C5A|nr:hypothetical protein [uncultured Marvinbryantia sp.]
MKQGMQGKDKKQKFSIIVIIVMLLIIIALLVQHYLLTGKPDDHLEDAVKAKLGQLEGKSEEEIQAELDRVIEEGMFHIAINTNPVFEDGSAEGNLEIENVPNNRYAMLVRIVRSDTGEQIYDSGLIDPNYHIQEDSLSVDLPAGDYPAAATFYAYDMETEEEIGSAGCEITITVLN